MRTVALQRHAQAGREAAVDRLLAEPAFLAPRDRRMGLGRGDGLEVLEVQAGLVVHGLRASGQRGRSQIRNTTPGNC